MPLLPLHGPPRFVLGFLIASALVVGVVVTGGCQPKASKPNRRSAAHRSAQQQARQANALFDSITGQLRTLSEATQLELRPPTVLLDSRSSTDREDILSIVQRSPEAPLGAPANLLTVPRRNARFRAMEIKPGDTIKYFVVPDKETMARLHETGEVDIVTMAAINLYVAQVLDDNSLLIAGGLPAEFTSPSKIEIWRNVDDRMKEINRRLGRYTTRRDPPLAWQPTPDEAVLTQMSERLNQWLRQTERKEAKPWPRPELLATLPATLTENERVAPFLTAEELASGAFRSHESRLLQEAVWIRDIGGWARGASPAVKDQAAALFDWTIRHIQLVKDSEEAPHAVWELLLYGRGTARQRAWVFASLCRQQRLPVAIVSVPTDEEGEQRLLAGVLSDEKLYLFDPTLGLPLPSADGKGIATLKQVMADNSLLRQLDIDDALYSLTADGFAKASLAIVAEPFTLTRRAATLGGRLSGSGSLVLTVDTEAEAERFKSVLSETPITLWDFPFHTLYQKLTANQATRSREVKRFLPFAWRPRLWKGRTLHFRGRLEKEAADGEDVLAEPANDHRDAQRLYMHRSVRPRSTYLDRVRSEVKREIYHSTKAQATYWLGTLALDKGDARNAINWLENKTLAAKFAEGLSDGIRYNLARAYEALDENEKAAELLEADDSPQRSGNRLRAKRLRDNS